MTLNEKLFGRYAVSCNTVWDCTLWVRHAVESWLKVDPHT